MTDKQAIIDYMRKRGWITQDDCKVYVGSTRLAARIWELKKDGHTIIEEMIKVHKRNGKTALVKRYNLAAPLTKGMLPI